MTTTVRDCNVDAAAWPVAVARRGAWVALACVILLLITPPTLLWTLLDSRVDSLWIEDAYSLSPALIACLAMPFLGPRAVHQVIGPPLSVRSALAGFACGIVGAVLSLVYWVTASRSLPPPDAISGPDYVHWLLSISLVAPLAEEWMCRGILWCAARRLVRPVLAILITASFFTLFHGLDRVREFPYLLTCGLLFGWLRHWSGSLSPSLLAHSVTNLSLMLATPFVLAR